ncbi:MAG: shikimate dehydrogenase [Chloroflexota bacterium]
MIHLGLIGYPLSHSLSPQLHAAAFRALGLDGEYQLYPVAPDDNRGLAELTQRLRSGELQGLNVTIPHKQTIIPLLDELTPSAQAIGAVNTLYLKGDQLVGHNTDAPGFSADLRRSFPEVAGEKNVIVMGAGGAARAVVYALLTDGCNVTLAVRRADVEQAAALIESMRPAAGDGSVRSVLLEAEALSPLADGIRLVVNATPLGMSPKVGDCPWPEDLPFPRVATVYDLVYNPRETLLLRRVRAAGLRAASGIGMLVEQAALSFACWTGREAPREVMFGVVEA